MAPAILEEYEPIEASAEERTTLAQVDDLFAHEAMPVAYLGGRESGPIPLPPSLFHVLRQVVHRLMQGEAIAVIPLHKELTTQQAADLLGVSRPHLIQLLERGAIPFRRVGTHRRIRYSDLAKYQQQREQESIEALDELARMSYELGHYT